MEEQQKGKKFDYKWVIIGVCFLMVLTCLGFCSSNKSLYLSPITEALGIKRSAFSVGDSIRYITTSVINIFFGALVARFGTKKLICAGFLCLMTSCLLYSFGTGLLAIYFAGMFLGLGFSWTTTTMVGCVVNKWCSEKKGTIMGLILASNGVGAALAAQILSPIIYGSKFGYKSAYLLTSGILLAVFLIVLIFYREKGKTDDEAGNNSKSKKKNSDAWVGMDLSVAKKKMYFYGTAVCIFLTGMMLQGITGIAAAHMKDVGLSAGHIATVLSVSSLSLTGSKFLAGFMYDKLGLRVTVTICNIAAVAAMLILGTLTNSSVGIVMAIVYGVLASIALPLETIMLPTFAMDLFGVKSFDQILGIFVSVNTAGYAVGVPLVNGIFDIFGSYKPILLVLSVVMVVVAVVLQFVITAAHKEKVRELEQA